MQLIFYSKRSGERFAYGQYSFTQCNGPPVILKSQKDAQVAFENFLMRVCRTAKGMENNRGLRGMTLRCRFPCFEVRTALFAAGNLL